MSVLRGKVAVVTGASQGIGEAAARAFAEEGCKVVLAARSEARLERLARELSGKLGADVLAHPCDVRDWTAIQSLAHATRERFGACDVLVNNAGVGIGGTLEQMSVENLDETLEVNLRGVMLVAKAFIPLVGRDATIFNIASVVAREGVGGLSAYSASKAGVRNFSQALGQELAPKGIRVVCIMPGFVATAMVDDAPYPPGEMIQPEDLAAELVRLATQPASSYVDEVAFWPRKLYDA